MLPLYSVVKVLFLLLKNYTTLYFTDFKVAFIYKYYNNILSSYSSVILTSARTFELIKQSFSRLPQLRDVFYAQSATKFCTTKNLFNAPA